MRRPLDAVLVERIREFIRRHPTFGYCHDREIVGWEFWLRGRAREAEPALEEACLHRFGTLRPDRPTPTIRSDNGLIFTTRRFRAACRLPPPPGVHHSVHPGAERRDQGAYSGR